MSNWVLLAEGIGEPGMQTGDQLEESGDEVVEDQEVVKNINARKIVLKMAKAEYSKLQ